MKKVTFILVVVIFLSMVSIGNLSAQEIKFPNPSQKAVVTQTVGLTDVTIVYHRPGVKGRVIWGDLVPYDKIWRTGANNATTIEFSADVMVQGNALTAGKYGLYTIPGKDEWTFIFSKQNDLWGAGGYKEDQDALRVKVKPIAAPGVCEWMMFGFTDLADNSAKVFLCWEKLMVGFVLKVETKKKVLKSIEGTMGRYWLAPYRAADYAFKEEMFDKAKEWIGASVSIKAIYWNMFLKAKIYKKTAKTKKEEKTAVKILEKALLLGKELPKAQQGYTKEGKELFKKWTGKEWVDKKK
ncbi:MAG: DUF2911 domain-containing protein [bacterium]|nr:DUF2911 domain-containing protein [bacterium]